MLISNVCRLILVSTFGSLFCHIFFLHLKYSRKNDIAGHQPPLGADGHPSTLWIFKLVYFCDSRSKGRGSGDPVVLRVLVFIPRPISYPEHQYKEGSEGALYMKS